MDSTPALPVARADRAGIRMSTLMPGCSADRNSRVDGGITWHPRGFHEG